MGANFVVQELPYVETQEELDGVWGAIHEQACYDYGHAGYSGTFAEKPNVIYHKTIPQFTNYQEAENWIKENNDKWEPADAVVVVDANRPKGEERFIVAGGWCSD